jgi:MerC mercury resistance protein
MKLRLSLFDGVGTATSFACLVHCLLLPVIGAWLPSLGFLLGLPESLHLLLFALAVPVSGGALIAGWRHHGALLPLLFGLAGLAALGLGALTGARPPLDTALTSAGALALASAHLGNWRLRSRAGPA